MAKLLYQQRHQGWPVLTYHLIDPSLCDRNAVTPLQFARHLDILLEKGFAFRSIDDIYIAYAYKAYDEPGVILAFDDAYFTTLEYAYPQLTERGIPYVLFVPIDCVGQTNLWNHKARYIRSHLSWDDLRFLQRGAVTFGSHGSSHHSLVKFDSTQIEE
jgi:peptidoglycan/xylan/chitin deacetylase (PgdA/CDA1 family)